MPNDFFHGLRVIELASVLAGPAVGMFFAELGAEVIKIENKCTGGDITRRWKLPVEDAASSASAYYRSINWGKKVHMLNLREPSARRQVYELIEQADLVISNFKPASARRLGMDYETLTSRNPGLIYAALTGFPDGEERPAFDVVLQAESGFLNMTGEPGRDPVKMPVALIDLLAAHQLKEGILLALLQRERTGKGSLVTTSLLEAAIASLANQASNWLNAGFIPERMGSRHPNIAPYGDIFSTRDDKLLVIAAGTESQFQQLCRVLEIPEVTEDERFATNADRVRHRNLLLEKLSPAFLRFDRTELMERFLEASVPAGVIRTMPEVFEIPAARRMVLEQKLEDGAVVKCVRTVGFQIKENRE